MTPGTPRVTIVIPACNEDEQIVPILDRLFESVRLPCEVLVIVDSDTDTTVPVVEGYAQKEDRTASTPATASRSASSSPPRPSGSAFRSPRSRRSQAGPPGPAPGTAPDTDPIQKGNRGS
jgi:glycosyltransferase involved in cell wall biosynthesis